MIDKCVDKLFESLPNHLKNITSPIEIDLVLEGGAFNGSYLVGALYFLKKMEKHKIIEVKRISGSSIGSFIGLLYFMDSLDLACELYNILIEDLKKHKFLNIIYLLNNKVKDKIPNDIFCKINNKLFISYTDINKKKKITVSKYKNVNDIIDVIIKSCFLPFVINGNICYKNKYIDGILPYIFPLENHRKLLYLDIMINDKIFHLMSVKNEKTNFHRIMLGLLDVHFFFIKNQRTSLCSYVNEWSIFDVSRNIVKKIIEKIIIYTIFFIIFLKKNISPEFKQGKFCKFIRKNIYVFYKSTIDLYCI